jgi:hypothetical protein
MLAVGLCLTCLGAAANDQDNLFPVPADLTDDVPTDFPRFHFQGHDEEAQALGRYLWYHYRHRGGDGPTVFNKEYLTTADLWMGGAVRPDWKRPIQDIHRGNLLGIQIDKEGYVHTHQHFSHAHEQGWPFPLWTQNPTGPEGVAAGWLFQDDGPGWAWDAVNHYPDAPWGRDRSIEGWTLDNVRSLGLVDKKWSLESTGPSPTLTNPEGARISTLCAPFLQLRWTRTGAPPAGRLPYVEWMREEDDAFSPERRVYFGFDTGNPGYEGVSGTTHSMVTMHRHPLWNGYIKRLRIGLAPGETEVKFTIDSFFTVYDTRHTINNPIYILACWDLFRWTGDVAFLKKVVNQMRLALRYQQTEMGGLEYNRIRNEWVGHGGRTGLQLDEDGAKTVLHGRGVGSNYWDLLPFGWDDMYATSQYYAATLAMASLEEAIAAHPEWGVPLGVFGFDPDALRDHADAVKKKANRMFWNRETGRFVACIDMDGEAHDFGFTFLNLDAIWYGIASDKHAKAILEWLSGDRIVDGDTSTGDDIYHWRFGPRATTKRNIEWYAFVWSAPESIPWGGQVQDGGAVLGFTFYDLWARLKVLGPDNAWERLGEILEWEKEVWAEGGYREYYKDGKRGTTLQGGGTAGGLGVDHEFYESSLLPAIIARGFLGLEPDGSALGIAPNLPGACPEMGISNVLYHGVRLDILASANAITVALKDQPLEPIHVALENGWRLAGAGQDGPEFALMEKGVYRFER